MTKIKSILTKIVEHLRRDPVLYISFAVALISVFFVPVSSKYLDYIDFRVLCLLLSLMLTVAGLKKVGLFDILTKVLLKFVHNTRALSAFLVGICFFLSMFITNDVALITFVPLSVMLLKEADKPKLLIPVIVMQTIAANLGSMFTPLGNPQNLYLYSLSGMSIAEFLKIMAIPSAISMILLIICLLFIKDEKINTPSSFNKSEDNSYNIKNILLWLCLFIVCLLAVVRIIHFLLALAIVIIAVIIFDRRILKSADYGLLLTFIFFFIFVGNIKSIPQLSSLLSELVSENEITCGIALSQIISNVPAAMLLSGFTTDYPSLLIGVNLGGLGTLIASMASVISYKIYVKTDNAKTGKYMALFSILNFSFLLILWVSTVILLPIIL